MTGLLSMTSHKKQLLLPYSVSSIKLVISVASLLRKISEKIILTIISLLVLVLSFLFSAQP